MEFIGTVFIGSIIFLCLFALLAPILIVARKSLGRVLYFSITIVILLLPVVILSLKNMKSFRGEMGGYLAFTIVSILGITFLCHKLAVGKKPSILIADDDPGTVSFLKELFEQQGYNIATANDGQEALEVFKKDPTDIDIAILDMVMPKISGLGVIEEIKTLAPKTKPLLITAYPGVVEEASKGRKIDFILKPFELEYLLERVNSSLKS